MLRRRTTKRKTAELDFLSPSSSSKSSKINKSIRSTQNQEKSYFHSILERCGFIFGEPGDSHILKNDQMLFANEVNLKLKGEGTFPLNLKDFVSGLEEYLRSEENMKLSLSDTKTHTAFSEARSSMQPSLLRMLLNVDCVQMEVMRILFEKLVELADSDSRVGGKYPWVQTILGQLRFLDYIADPVFLCNSLFEVFEAVPSWAQVEIINCIPDVISDGQHQAAAIKISHLVREKFDQIPTLLESLNYLNMDDELSNEIIEQVLRSLNLAPVEFIPNIIKFLTSNSQPKMIKKITSDIRKNLDFTPIHNTSGKESNVENSKVLSFAALKMAIISSTSMADTWIDIVEEVSPPNKHKPVDIVMLIIIHSSKRGLKKKVEGKFRSKIKLGHFDETLLEKTFTSLEKIMNEYFRTVLDITSVLLKTADTMLTSFASSCIKLCLSHFETHLRQAPIEELLRHIGINRGCCQPALNILSDLCKTNLDNLLAHQRFMLNLLDPLEDFNLSQVQQVMDVLCQLAFSEKNNDDILKDELHMLIRKYLWSVNLMTKKKGVIGAIMAAKALATRNNSDSDSSSSSTTNTPSGKVKEAIDFLELILTLTRSSPEALGLFFDELSTMIALNIDLDESFVGWINNNLVADFETAFIVDVSDINLASGLSIQHEINNNESLICVPLAKLVKKEMLKECESIKIAGYRVQLAVVVMIPYMRLLRIVKHWISNGVLDEIDGLLVCGVVMPDCDMDLFSMSGPEEMKLTVNCVFYLINWFRELINAFSFQKTQLMQEKVLARIQNVLDLQKLVLQMLAQIHDYSPPHCQFYGSKKVFKTDSAKRTLKEQNPKAKKKSKGKSKKKANETVLEDDDDDDDDNHNNQDTNFTQENETTEVVLGIQKQKIFDLKPFYRELDLDVLILLCRPLNLENSSSTSLDAAKLLFLLEDYVGKLEFFYAPSKVGFFNQEESSSVSVGYMNLNHTTPEQFLKNALKLMPHICTKLEAVAGYCEKLLHDNDGVLDSPGMFDSNTTESKHCFYLLLRSLDLIFSWNGLQNKSNHNFMRDALRILASRLNSQNAENNSIKELVCESLKYLKSFVKRVVHLDSASSLVQLVEGILKLCPPDGDLNKQLAKICFNFLSHRWYTYTGSVEKGANYNRKIKLLLRCFLNYVDDILKVESDMLKWILEEVLEEKDSKDWCLKSFPSISKSNFHLIVTQVFVSLNLGLKKSLDATESNSAKLQAWKKAVFILRKIEEIVDAHSSNTILAVVIKNSQITLKMFLQTGMNVIDCIFKLQRDEAIVLIKDQQKYNRFLHKLCYHCKANKFPSVTPLIPAMRRTLEAVRFGVKSILVRNGCIDAFKAGNLHNRNLQGEIIPSQSTVNDDEFEDDEGNTSSHANVESDHESNDEAKGHDNDDENDDDDDGEEDEDISIDY